jgi:hypothetical protein
LWRVVFLEEVVSALELAMKSTVCVAWAEVHLFLCISSMSADVLRCHLGKQGTRVCGFDEA